MVSRAVRIGERELRLGNLDKPLYPDGFTKAQVIDYYARVAPVMLPHLAGRPVSLRRYPDGVEGNSFFEKNCPSHRPRWIRTVPLGSRSADGSPINFCQLDEPAALVWVANLAAIELHVYLHRSDAPEHPTMLVFDLDPGAPAGFGQCAAVAFKLRELLEHLNMSALPKNSGGKGLHLYVPMREQVDYDHTKSLARSLAQRLARDQPSLVTDRMSKPLRAGKVFVDWSQNTASKTTVCVYSLRATRKPSVSTPMNWDELQPWLDRPDTPTPRFTPEQVLARIDEHGDLFEPLTRV